MLSPARVNELVILVVDDEVVVRNFLQRLLSREGFAVMCAANAQEALALFRACPRIDLVASDIEMPETDGFALAQQLRQEQPELKILFISGKLTGNGPVPAQFIPKPFPPQAILAKVRAMLGLGANEQPPASAPDASSFSQG